MADRFRFCDFPKMTFSKVILPLFGAALFLQTAGIIQSPFFQTDSAGVVYAQSEQSQYQAAYDLYTQAAALPSNSPQKTQAWNKVIDAFTAFIAQYPNSTRRNESELFLGYAYLMRSGYTNAQDGEAGRSHLYYIIQQGKTSSNEDLYRKALLQYAYSYFSLLDYRNAKPNLEKFIAEFPKSDDLQYAYYYAGVTEANLGNYIKAQEYFQTCLTQFPNGARRDLCLLEQAAADGRAGNYERADNEFFRLSMDANYPYHLRASLERTYLKVLQDDYNGALTLLDQFIAANQNDPANNDLIREAYGYKAFCYLRLGNYQAGLDAIAQIEKMDSSLTPQVAYLKIQLLTKLGRFNEADALLRQIQNSVMSLANSDIIPYYDSTIRLGEGNYEKVIKEILSFANITQSPSNPNQYEIHYFDTAASGSAGKLSPQDYLNACGNLVLAFASRYGLTKNPTDNANQQAVFQAMSQYVSKQTDPVLMKIMQLVDKDRNDAMTNPIGAVYATSNRAGNGTYPGDSQIQPWQPNLNQSQGASSLQPTLGPPVADNANNPNTPQPQPGNAADPNNPSNPQVAQNGNPQEGVAANSEAKPEEPKPLTQEEAEAMLKKALDAHAENRFEDANNELLNLMTSSDTLWTDYPRIAAKAALLRANILFMMGEYDEGQTVCDLLIKMAPNSAEAADACYQCARRAEYYGNSAKTIEYLQTAINSPQEGNFRPQCYYMLAWNEWERKNADLAEQYFSKLYRDYQNSTYWSHAAWAYAQLKYQSREYTAAETIVNNTLAAGPDDNIVDSLLLLKGELALKNRDFVKARIAYRTILREYPQSPCYRTALNRMRNIEELSEDYIDNPEETVMRVRNES